jgi:hypothetical protein
VHGISWRAASAPKARSRRLGPAYRPESHRLERVRSQRGLRSSRRSPKRSAFTTLPGAWASASWSRRASRRYELPRFGVGRSVQPSGTSRLSWSVVVQVIQAPPRPHHGASSCPSSRWIYARARSGTTTSEICLRRESQVFVSLVRPAAGAPTERSKGAFVGMWRSAYVSSLPSIFTELVRRGSGELVRLVRLPGEEGRAAERAVFE